MDLRTDSQSTDEYFVTALQIFDYCGSESTGTLRVDALMEKFAPFVKTNKTEYSRLKSILDPEQSNPEINVTRLAKALDQYSESQKPKVDLDESFNLQTGQLMPQDSDSGISGDGFQILEELQCELREKAHLAHKLRNQLEFTDRQHEEVLATITAERDSLQAHLNMLREENVTLANVRRDYEDACERLCATERALDESRRELEACRRRARGLHEEVTTLAAEKITLQELLTKSKDECHRINEMYASRQSALLEENETLKAEHAYLSSRLHDQLEYVQQMIKDKTMLEMELKDVLNKSNMALHPLERSIEVSYTEDQMLTALDNLNADSRFSPENQLLGEESFLKALKEDQGRSTNVSLFDELRLSISRHIEINNTYNSENSMITIGTQTDDGFSESAPFNNNHIQNCSDCLKVPQIVINKYDISFLSMATQTEENMTNILPEKEINFTSIATQTMTIEDRIVNLSDKAEIKCPECENLIKYATKLESDLNYSHSIIKDLQLELDKYEDNLNLLQKFTNESNERNNLLQTIVHGLQSKIGILEAACANQSDRIKELSCDTSCAECQTDCDVTSVSTQAEVPCLECAQRTAAVPQRRLRKYLWEPLKCLFQMFAVICFVAAVSVLYVATQRWGAGCERGRERGAAVVPWRWLDAHEFLDLLLRIEYVADVPM